MKYRLIALAFVVAWAGAAQAGPQPGGQMSITASHSEPRPQIKWRLVRDADTDPYPVHHSGVVARTDVAPNVSLGVGLLKATPKKPGSGDHRFDNGAPRSRKGIVSFLVRF